MEWTPDSIMYSDAIKHCLVIDTNVFLTDLKSITIVIDQFLPGNIYIYFYYYYYIYICIVIKILLF